MNNQDLLQRLVSSSPFNGLNVNKDACFKARYGSWGVTYDTALPQTTMDTIREKTGVYNRMFVYGYGERVEGFIPLDNTASQLLEIYFHITGINLMFPECDRYEI